MIIEDFALNVTVRMIHEPSEVAWTSEVIPSSVYLRDKHNFVSAVRQLLRLRAKFLWNNPFHSVHSRQKKRGMKNVDTNVVSASFFSFVIFETLSLPLTYRLVFVPILYSICFDSLFPSLSLFHSFYKNVWFYFLLILPGFELLSSNVPQHASCAHVHTVTNVQLANHTRGNTVCNTASYATWLDKINVN